MRLTLTRPKPIVQAALALGVAMLLCSTAGAEERPSREREALRRVQQSLRDAQAAAASLQQEKDKQSAELQTQIKQAGDQLARAQGSAKAQEKRAAELDLQLAQEKKQREDTAQQLQRAQAQTDDLARQLKDSTARADTLEDQLLQRETTLSASQLSVSTCEAKNQKLYAYGTALLARYQSKGVWDTLAQRDPVFGFKQVEIDNLLQEYRDKLNAERTAPRPASDKFNASAVEPAHQ